jgi:hypothetical protein
VRIGVAFAKGLTAARQLPVAGVTTLDILAAANCRIRAHCMPYSRRTQARGLRPLSLSRRHWQVEGAVVIAVGRTGRQIAEPALIVGEIDPAGHAALQARRKLLTSRLRPGICAAPDSWPTWRGTPRAGQTADALTLTPIYVH